MGECGGQGIVLWGHACGVKVILWAQERGSIGVRTLEMGCMGVGLRASSWHCEGEAWM